MRNVFFISALPNQDHHNTLGHRQSQMPSQDQHNTLGHRQSQMPSKQKHSNKDENGKVTKVFSIVMFICICI